MLRSDASRALVGLRRNVLARHCIPALKHRPDAQSKMLSAHGTVSDDAVEIQILRPVAAVLMPSRQRHCESRTSRKQSLIKFPFNTSQMIANFLFWHIPCYDRSGILVSDTHSETAFGSHCELFGVNHSLTSVMRSTSCTIAKRYWQEANATQATTV